MANEIVTQTVPPAKEPEVNISRWLSQGWNLVSADFGNYLLLTLVYLVILVVASSTALGIFLVHGPLKVGFFYIIFNRIRGREFRIGDIAKGFSFFVAAVLVDILTGVFISLGFIFCILPGFLLMAAYMFAYAFVLEKNMDFWTAMEASHKVVARRLFDMTIFVIVQLIVLLIGLLFCGVGLLVAIPVVYAAIAYAYKDLVGLEDQTA